MNYPILRVRKQRECRIDRFLGLDRGAGAPDGSFRDLLNLSGDRFPALRTCPARRRVGSLDGCPTGRVLALGGKGFPVVLDASGSLWCGGNVLPRLLRHSVAVTVTHCDAGEATVTDEAAVLSALVLDGDYTLTYSFSADKWISASGARIAGTAVNTQYQPYDGETLSLRIRTTLQNPAARSLVFLGGWVLILPDGRYANAVRLRDGATMTEHEDYGSVDLENACDRGGAVFTPCGADGTARSVTVSQTAPASGLWVDPDEAEPTLRYRAREGEDWEEATPYVRCAIPGIARGVRAGDAVRLSARLSSGQQGEEEVEALFSGTKRLEAVWHDPGAANRDEGSGDWIVIAGMLPGTVELELTWHNQDFFSLHRVLPQMDFVVEAQNRLWGCRWGGGVNELYGCKLGDFCNWEAFDGLSTDSYRVSRGVGGPFTGAAVLDGKPLFFRENSLEKIYPAAAGDHGVVTVSLSGIMPGSASSAVVLRDRLYYHSREGICRYDGTLPVCVSKALGPDAGSGAVGGARGGSCCFSLADAAGETSIYVLDTDAGLWFRESGSFALTWFQGGTLYFTETVGGPLSAMGAANEAEGAGRRDEEAREDEDEPSGGTSGEGSGEGGGSGASGESGSGASGGSDGSEASGQSVPAGSGVSWYAETGPLGPVLRTKRYVSRLRIAVCPDEGAVVRAYLSYDGGPWQLAGVFTAPGRQTRVFPIYPRRSGSLRLRLAGEGGMELRSLSWILESGSDEN